MFFRNTETELKPGDSVLIHREIGEVSFFRNGDTIYTRRQTEGDSFRFTERNVAPTKGIRLKFPDSEPMDRCDILAATDLIEAFSGMSCRHLESNDDIVRYVLKAADQNRLFCPGDALEIFVRGHVLVSKADCSHVHLWKTWSMSCIAEAIGIAELASAVGNIQLESVDSAGEYALAYQAIAPEEEKDEEQPIVEEDEPFLRIVA
ncbi:MAG: hypothetical protein WC477_05750 [Patescibacteria group bacterium]